MSGDRTVRSLTALGGASTSRVLNLVSIAAANAGNPEYRAQPLFRSPVINASVLLKHRIRSDETYVFAGTRTVATKIIIPFDLGDLRAGGRSILIDQRGYHQALRDVGKYRDDDFAQDLKTLRVLDQLPSLDPFLVREHLRAAGVECADCYYNISRADQERMFAFVSSEIRRLIELATGAGENNSTARLVGALLSTEVDEKLEPLRLTLAMQPEEFREGVFSWRGFLYYKWCIEQQWPQIIEVLKEIRRVEAVGVKDPEARIFLTTAQQSIVEKVYGAVQSVRRTLAVYDRAYNDLVQNQTAGTFREFLLGAPNLFLDLGEKMGATSHIASSWRYRFPAGASLSIIGDELSAIFQDFLSNFAAEEALLRY